MALFCVWNDAISHDVNTVVIGNLSKCEPLVLMAAVDSEIRK